MRCYFRLPARVSLASRATWANFPMSYSQALGAMRHFMSLPWQDSSRPVPVTLEESSGFTLHSRKVCLLAAGAQVRAAEEARQHQGHHKSPSVQLYTLSAALGVVAETNRIASQSPGVALL